MKAIPFSLVLCTALAVSTTSCAFFQEQGEVEFALKGLDPVELVTGQEIAGEPTVAATFGKYRYAFSSQENLATFEKDPARYAVQFGGACMRMGPLSGGGSSDRYHVHDGRIYLFASESCRSAFKSNPARFIDVADPEPPSTKEAEEQAASLLRKAVDGLGGEAALRNLKTLEVRLKVSQKSGEKVVSFSRISATSFPLTFTRLDDYGDYKGGWTLHPDQGYLSWEHGVPVDESVRQFMLREYYRLPIHLLKAWQDGEANAVAADSETIGDTNADCVIMALHGATTRVYVRPDDGLIVRVSYRARAHAGIADIVRDFSDYRNINGLMIPFGVTTLIDGKPQENVDVVVESVRVNEPIDAALLAKPQ